MTEVNLEPVKYFLAINYFRNNGPSQMFGKVLNGTKYSRVD